MLNIGYVTVRENIDALNINVNFTFQEKSTSSGWVIIHYPPV